MNPCVTIQEAVLDPLRPLFMQRALVEVLVLAVPAGLLGAWVVTRRLAFVTHSVGHATFPALVIAVLAGWSLFASSLVAAVVLALGLAWLARSRELGGGAAVAIVLAASLALGAVLVSDVSDPGLRANTLLFGSLLAIGWDEVLRSAVVAAVTVGCTLVFGRRLAAATFHEELATVDGIGVRVLDGGLMVLLAATVAVALAASGSLLVASLLLVPSATARFVTRRLVPLMLAGMAFAAFDGVAGLLLAYHLDAPPGAGIAAVAAGIFALLATASAWYARRSRQLVSIPS
jgi:ABC-type Mn2+/Zn2+ transport system permease subunit